MTEFIRRYSLGFAVVNIGLLCYLFAFPLLDLQYNFESYNFAWWSLFVFIIFNLILPLLLAAVVAGHENPARTDLHSMWTVFTVVVNAVTLIFLSFIYFVFVNTSYSGDWPFNDDKWCCKYYMAHPELCFNVVPCTPVPTSLSPNYMFTMFWIFSLVLLFVSLLHLGVNQLLRKSGAVAYPDANASEGRILGLVVAFVYALVFVYWAAWPLWDTQFIQGYPLMGIPPGPGPYWSTIGNFQWWFIWLIALNIIPPIVFVMAIAWQKRSHIITNAHYWLSLAVSIAGIMTFLVCLGILIFNCNYSWSGLSICNSDLYCCHHYPSNPALCPNVGPCPGDAFLYPNGEFTQHLVFSLVFSILSLIQVWINFRMQRYGVFA